MLKNRPSLKEITYCYALDFMIFAVYNYGTYLDIAQSVKHTSRKGADSSRKLMSYIMCKYLTNPLLSYRITVNAFLQTFDEFLWFCKLDNLICCTTLENCSSMNYYHLRDNLVRHNQITLWYKYKKMFSR